MFSELGHDGQNSIKHWKTKIGITRPNIEKNFCLGSLTVPKQMAMNEQMIKKTSILHLHSTVKL